MEANVQSQTGPELAKQVIYTLNIQPLSHFGDQRGSKSKTRNRFNERYAPASKTTLGPVESVPHSQGAQTAPGGRVWAA